jgi:hypothetical protein
MSTSPIGTRVPTLSPNAIIRAGIPLSDNFNATDVAVSLESLFSSGVFTSTPSGEINLSVSADNATYIRVGNIVNCAVLLGINFSAGENSGVFELSLPVASDLTSQKQCFGTLQWAITGTQSELVALTIGGNTTNNTCQVGIEVVTDELIMEYCTLQFQYEIV